MKLSEIAARLQLAPPPAPLSPPLPPRQAAVAILLQANADSSVEVLFIRRAEKTGDPWSGHMAFPGGHKDPEDDSLLAAAMRETWEEVGIDLHQSGQLLASLQPLRPLLRTGKDAMLVAPFVFQLHKPINLRPNHEVAEAIWTPLAPIYQAQNHTEEARLVEGSAQAFAGYQLGDGYFVWGLTYRMLHGLFELLDPHWRPPSTD